MFIDQLLNINSSLLSRLQISLPQNRLTRIFTFLNFLNLKNLSLTQLKLKINNQFDNPRGLLAAQKHKKHLLDPIPNS